LLVAATNLTISARKSLACECAPPPPPCAAYGETPMIFLGTVVEAIETENGRVVLARMRLDKAYKGISEETVLLYDDGMCDGPPLRMGEQYLIYTHDSGTSYLPSRGCTRSRRARDANEDLAFLDSLSGAAPTGTISGKVTITADTIAGNENPASGVMIELHGEGEKLATTTDSEGRYSFLGLKPGSYVARAIKPGFSEAQSQSEDTAEVEARGCAVRDFVLHKIWPGTIGGRVVRSDGSAAPAGLSVDLIRTEGRGRDQKSKPLIGATVETDENGEYSFNGVAPGSYKIALNLGKVPTAQDPYLTTYWPGTSAEATASTVEVGENASSLRCDFRLPLALQSTPVRFVVLLPDGAPAKEVRANIGTQMNGMFGWADSVMTDASGEFSFWAIQGLEYTVMDIMADEAVMSSQVHFSASDRTQPITIRLAPKD